MSLHFRNVLHVCLLAAAVLFCSMAGSSPARAQQPTTATNVADWPAPRYDAGRTSYNAFETSLMPPFTLQPVLEIAHSGADDFSGVIADDMLLWHQQDTTTPGGEILAATDLDGNPIWGYSVAADAYVSVGRPTVTDDTVVFVESGFSTSGDDFLDVVALDRESGNLLWKHDTRISSHMSGAIISPFAVKDGRVIIGWTVDEPRTGYIGAFDLRSGQELWRTVVDNVGSRQTYMTAVTGNVVVANHFTHMAGYDLLTGERLWLFDAFEGSGLITDVDDIAAANGRLIVTHPERTTVYNAADGAEIWHNPYDRDACDRSDKILAVAQNTVYVMGDCGTNLAAYDFNSGAERWRLALHRNASEYHIAVANGFVYVNGYDDAADTGYVAAVNAADGTLVQRLDARDLGFGGFGFVRQVAVANGRLYTAINRIEDNGVSTSLYAWGGGTSSSDLYLGTLDNDSHALTNPTARTPLPLTRRDGEYGAEISVGARIGSSPATLKIYGSDGTVYKEAVAQPDAHGNGYWVAPLEYSAEGYQYEVILDDGTELPRRAAIMPADPAAHVEAIVQTSSLQWQSPPASVTQVPTTLRLALPNDFPAGETGTTLFLQEPGRGMVTVTGQRDGNTLEFELNGDQAINGEFTATAVAQAGKVKAYSPDHTLEIDVTSLPDVRPSFVTLIAPTAEGEVESATFQFERSRPQVDPAQQVDAQIASIVPDPAGYQVTLWVTTPPEDPDDPRTGEWEVGIRALDEGGSEIDRSLTEVEATPEGRYLVLGVVQQGTRTIASIEAFGSTLEDLAGNSRYAAEAAALACQPPSGPSGPGGPGPSPKDMKASDVFGLTADVGVAGEVVLGAGPSSAGFVQGDFISGQTQACAEAGMRIGGEIGAGPAVALGGSVNLRGPGHTAPANSGKKYDLTVSAGVGVQVSYTVPDNFGDSGFGQLGLSVTAAPEAGISGGASTFTCWPPQNEKLPEPDKCCTGPDCGPNPGPNPPGPPGGDHPDDTHSVVLQNDGNDGFDGDEGYWRSVARYARSQGYEELAQYAGTRLVDFGYLSRIADIPAGQTLNEDQSDTVAAFHVNRLLAAAEMGANRPVILTQMREMGRAQANVLANGYYAEMRSMLTTYGIPNRLVGVGFSPDDIAGGLLVIPSAGLYGLEGSGPFADRLHRFVTSGGTLVVMAQPDDAGLQLLPETWEQVGYQTDISCFVDAMTPVTYHPVLASISSQAVTAHVDGYLTQWPGEAQLLMKRTKNNEGAFVLYEAGEGRMFVTNMYDDWGRTVGQSSHAVRDLFRDVMRWAAVGGDDLPEARPGDSVTVDAEVQNLVATPATTVRWAARNPDGVEVASGLDDVALDLTPGASAQLSPSFTPGSADLGIWSLNYTLLDGAGETVQGETLAGYFVVSDPPVSMASAVTGSATADGATAADPVRASSAITAGVSLALDQAAYAPGDTVQATLAISLADPGAVSDLLVQVSLGEELVEQVVPAQASQQVQVDLPADFSRGGLLFYGVYDDASGQGLHLDTRWVQRQGSSVTVLPDKPRYAPGETVTLDLQGNVTGQIRVDGPDFAQVLDPAGQAAVAFDLPATLASGPVEVIYDDAGMRRTARFDVAGPRVTVKSMTTTSPVADAGSSVEVTAQVESDRSLDVQVLGTTVDGDGTVRSVLAENRTLSEGIQDLVFTMPLETGASGNVRVELRMVDQNDPSVEYVRAHRLIVVDAPQLLAIRAGTDSFAPTVTKEVTLDWYSPSAQTIEVDFWLDGEMLFSRSLDMAAGFGNSTVTLPDVRIGSHTLYAEADLGEITTRASALIVVGAGLDEQLYLPVLER